jgi:hypothetical protein
MSYPSCFNLTNLAATCDAVKKVGGVKSRFWIGQKPDIASLTFGSNGEVTAMTLTGGKKLGRYEGVQFKNTAQFDVVPGENRNMFTQTFTGILFYKTQIELEHIEKLFTADRMFVIVETEAGQLKAYGIDQNPYKAADLGPERGLNISAGTGSEGVLLADTTGVTVTMAADFYNPTKLYKPATAIATVIAELDALSA